MAVEQGSEKLRFCFPTLRSDCLSLLRHASPISNATTRTLQAPQISRHRSALIPNRAGTSAASTPCRSSFCPLA